MTTVLAAQTVTFTCPLCGDQLRTYGGHFFRRHGEPAGLAASPLRVAIALACADRVSVERAADLATSGIRPPELHPDDKWAAAVALLRTPGHRQAVVLLGFSGTTVKALAELVDADAIPVLPPW